MGIHVHTMLHYIIYICYMHTTTHSWAAKVEYHSYPNSYIPSVSTCIVRAELRLGLGMQLENA